LTSAVQSDSSPRYEQRAAPTSFTPFETRVRALLEDDPELPAKVLAERVGWEGSITWFRENVKRPRPAYRKVDPADRLSWEPGDAAQWREVSCSATFSLNRHSRRVGARHT
jgi:hypothetical protein